MNGPGLPFPGPDTWMWRCTALAVSLGLAGCAAQTGTSAQRMPTASATPTASSSGIHPMLSAEGFDIKSTTPIASGSGAPAGLGASTGSMAAPPRPVTAERSSALPATGLSTQDIQAITAHHNKVRADVGVAPLTWSVDIAGYAQQWAEQLAISGCRMKHRSPNDFGENLFQGTVGAFTAVDAAKAWETEKKDYTGGVLTEANWAPAGHYTQMVWRQTTQLGCGQAICRNTLIVACNYAPAGNVIGRRPY